MPATPCCIESPACCTLSVLSYQTRKLYFHVMEERYQTLQDRLGVVPSIADLVHDIIRSSYVILTPFQSYTAF